MTQLKHRHIVRLIGKEPRFPLLKRSCVFHSCQPGPIISFQGFVITFRADRKFLMG